MRRIKLLYQNIINWLIGFDERDRRWVDAIKKKSLLLEEFNGKLVVRGKGLYHEFESKEDEKAYWRSVKNSIKNKKENMNERDQI